MRVLLAMLTGASHGLVIAHALSGESVPSWLLATSFMFLTAWMLLRTSKTATDASVVRDAIASGHHRGSEAP